ncbi:MAG: hypothetical protein AB1444_15235 [Spirochaetota bacterium]
MVIEYTLVIDIVMMQLKAKSVGIKYTLALIVKIIWRAVCR